MKKSIPKTIALSCYRPLKLLLLEPMVTLLCMLSAVLLGILYLFFGVRQPFYLTVEVATPLISDQAFQLVFQNNHNFNEWQTGLTFLGIFVGMAAGVMCDPLWRRNCECAWVRGLHRKL